MRYWLYDKASKQVLGPYIIARLTTLPGFGPESKVAPDGARKRSEWKPAK